MPIGFGERLRFATAERGMYLTELADAVGVDRRTVYSWADEKFFPTAIKLYQICRALDVSADWLLGLEVSDDAEQ